MKGIDGIIFDCDGVLFESRQANLAYYNAVLAQLGETPVRNDEQERAHLCHTAASPAVFAGLLGNGRVEEAMTVAADLDYRQFIPAMEPEAGLVEALSALSQARPLAIATNRGFSMPQILDHFSLREYFSVVVTSRDVARPKPHPDMLFEAARQLQLPVGRLLFIGDSELDFAAASAAGMPFAAYRQALDADCRLESHLQLLDLFAGS